MSIPMGGLSWWLGAWREMPRFVVAGGVATAVHWATMAAALVVGTPALLATALGAGAGAVCNFRLQRGWVFGGQVVAPGVGWRYVSAAGVLWLLNLVSLGLLHHGVGLTVAWAQVLTTLWVTLISFLVMKRGVYA